MNRCDWSTTDPLLLAYHDEEWGVPVHDDQKQFEFLTLESAQAGLSWLTILRKRENYRSAFARFDVEKVAAFTDDDVERLMGDAGIVRNRRKILAAINNAARFIEISDSHGTFCDYFWAFVDGEPINNGRLSMNELPAKTEIAERLSGDLKKRGFKFVGPTTIYSHMQAAGLVNDHIVSCFRYSQVQS